MELYIEAVFLNNFMINVLILYATTFIDKVKPKFYRLFISGAIGGIFAVLFPIINLNSILIKIGISILMLIILKKYIYFKDFIYTLVIFYIITLTLGGGVLMLSTYSPFDLNKTLINYKMLPFIVGIIGSLILLLSEKLYIYVNKSKNINKFIYKVKINDKYEALAYYDTGNKLYHNDNTVIVISNKLFKQAKLEKIGSMAVSTINGIKENTLCQVKLEFDDNKKQKFTTFAVISDSLDNKIYSIILHKDQI